MKEKLELESQIQKEEKKVLEKELSDGKVEVKKFREVLETVEKALETCKSDLAESEQKIKDMVEANKKLQVRRSVNITEIEILYIYTYSLKKQCIVIMTAGVQQQPPKL